MAFKKNYLDEQMQGQQPGGSGGILAGNSGSGPSQQPSAAGSGWTNLNTYLDMNKGQTEGLANTYNDANQQVVDSAKAIGSDLVKKTQEDATWSAPITQAKDMTNQIRSGDLSKVDANQFKTIQGSSYQKPQDYSKLNGYGDVIGAFSKAAERVDNADDYGTQQTTLRDQFGKQNPRYNSGMATLDTFLLRADPQAAARTAQFKEQNKDYGSLKTPDGKPAGISNRFNSDVSGVLDNFFGGKEAEFNAAKQDLSGAVGQRRGAIESAITPEMIAARKAEIDAANLAKADELSRKAKESGVVTSRKDFEKYGSSKGVLDAADLMSDADLEALSYLESLDGGRSFVQDQARGDYGVSFDEEAAMKWINDNIPPPAPAPQNPAVTIGSPSSPTSRNDWADTSKPQQTVDKSRDTVVDKSKDRVGTVRDWAKDKILTDANPTKIGKKVGKLFGR